MGRKEVNLTETEKSIIKLIIQGKSNEEIAKTRKTKLNTIKHQRWLLMHKLGFRRTAQLTKYLSERFRIKPHKSEAFEKILSNSAQTGEIFKIIFNQLPYAIIILDLNSRIKYFSEKAFQAFGFKNSDKVNNLNFLNYIAKEYRRFFRDHLKSIIEETCPACFEYICIRKDKTVFPAEIDGYKILSRNGKAHRILLFLLDVSDLKNKRNNGN